MESLFRFLFKYRPIVFSRGDLAFEAGWPWWALVGALVLVGALAVIPYVRVAAGLRRWERTGLAGARFGVLALLVWCLTRPILVVPTVVPQQNYLGVVVDDSRSMQVDDGDGPRSAQAARLFAAEGPLLSALADKFRLRFFRFGDGLERVDGIGGLAFTERRTDLARALTGARADLGNVPLAGIVVVTDGADNRSGPALDEAVVALAADGVPVYPVGVGREQLAPDVEVSRVVAPREVIEGSSVTVDVTLRHAGYDGRSVTVTIEDGGRIVGTRSVALPRGSDVASARLHFTATEPGPRRVRVSVATQPDERISRNNALTTLVAVTDRPARVLYFEGEPRFEIKFIRRAVAEDDQVHVVSLVRTADDKFLRLDVRDSAELAGGFPTSRRELFAYRGLVLGSVEASFFTHDQLQMIADFVSQRGGGLLALGGRRALAEGGYAETPVATVLPLVLDPSPSGDTATFFAEVRPALTPAGRGHPVTQIAADEEASAARWAELPSLSIVNPVRRIKPGATMLLRGERDGGDPLVMLAYQRFGRGKAIAFPVQDSWIWQMHADIPLDDLTHETLWRQLLRWLVNDVPRPVTTSTAEDRVEPGDPVHVTARVVDEDYLELNVAEVSATITSPAGDTRHVPLEWTVERNGEYAGAWTPAAPGLYTVEVEARQGTDTVGLATTYVDVGDLGAEFFGAQMRAPLLQRVARETGGRFYTADDVASLPEDVSLTESGTTVYERRSLWDMPIVFLGLVALVSGEWIYRRRRGLP